MIEKQYKMSGDFREQFIENTANGQIFYFYRVVDELNRLAEDNEQLQERNDRQAERLRQFHDLILNRDYDGQEKMIKELEESERLLREEWRGCFE